MVLLERIGDMWLLVSLLTFFYEPTSLSSNVYFLSSDLSTRLLGYSYFTADPLGVEVFLSLFLLGTFSHLASLSRPYYWCP
jgi:hypothetical protein